MKICSASGQIWQIFIRVDEEIDQGVDSMRQYLLLSLVALLLAGCVQPPSRSYLCSDGKTIVSSMAECPQVDQELQTCNALSAASASDYGSSSSRDQCFYSLAVTRANVSLCNKILSSDNYDSYSRAMCGAKVAEMSGGVAACEQLLLPQDTYDCYSQYAYDRHDYKLCSKITDPDSRDSCLNKFVEYGSESSDWTICDQFSSQSSKNSCLYSAAEGTYDLGYCNKIVGSSFYSKAECYGEVATGEQDPSVCANLTTVKDRDSCYYNYATSAYDPDACKYLSSSGQQERCVRNANSSSYYE